MLQVSFREPRALARLPAFVRALGADERHRGHLYRDPGWLDQARAEIDRFLGPRWNRVFVDESRAYPELGSQSIGEMARQRGTHPFDVMVELALAEDLSTRFRIVLFNEDEQELSQLLLDERTVLGLSDAGAHGSQLCDACAPTYLLSYWHRQRGVLSLEQAVWRLTGQPAAVFGMSGRGSITPGSVADLVVFDPTTVGPREPERVADLPGGAERIVVRASGIEFVFVNGEPIIATRALRRDISPGQLVR
jgi:N-acyl-D-aspartate/D-glutamate deacylase